MLSNQDLYNKACASLRANGNHYGSLHNRGWGWVNSCNPSERCAIARFIPGITDKEVRTNLLCALEQPDINYNSLIHAFTSFFDHEPISCNSRPMLENRLKAIADRYKLKYNAPIQNKEVVAELETA